MLTSLRSLKYLPQHNFAIINDLKFFFHIWKKSNNNNNDQIDKTKEMKKYNEFIQLFKKILKKLIIFLENIKIFDNSSTFIIFCNVINLFFILIFFFTIPIDLCFNIRLINEYEYLYYMQAYFFTIDIFVNFNTAFIIMAN